MSYSNSFLFGKSGVIVKNSKTKFVSRICKKTMERHQYYAHLKGWRYQQNSAIIKTHSETGLRVIPSSSFIHPNIPTSIPPLQNSSIKNNAPPEFTMQPNGWFLCNVCQALCNSKENLRDHLNGIKHQKKLDHMSEQIQINSKSRAGHEFIEVETSIRGQAIEYKCTLCHCSGITRGSIGGHLKGRRHMLNFKHQIDNSVVVGPKSPVRTMRKVATKLEKELARQEFWKGKDDHLAMRKKKTLQKWNAKEPYQSDADIDDDFNDCIMRKYNQIGMEPNIQLQVLLWFSDCCESALKLVSDEFLARDGHHGDDSRRTLKGTMRVGVLGNKQILKKDQDFHIVLLLSTKPTLSLLDMIRKSLSSKLRSVMSGHPFEKETDFVVKNVPEEARLSVNMVHPFTFNVFFSLTSSHFEDIRIKGEADDLDAVACRESLKELKRADWFQARLNYLNEGLKVLRVLRQLRLEDEVWNIISDWANEILIERCTFVQGQLARPSTVMRCYLELLSSGLLFDGPGLKDPCDYEQTDLFKELTAQQKENITQHAQKCLRLLSFKRSHVFLNVDSNTSKKNQNQG